MKENTPEQQLDLLCSQIIRERDHWNYINENGCNDPFWPDGCNMNLTRNHIISYKRDIAELCEKLECHFRKNIFEDSAGSRR